MLSVKNLLLNAGIYETELDQDNFEKLAATLGMPVSSRKNGPLIDILISKAETDAHKNSLSATNGLGNFPFHTDGAYFHTPPRFIALRYSGLQRTDTPTLFFPFLDSLNNEEIRDLMDDLWMVRGRLINFYSGIISNGQAVFVRFDANCMRPVNSKPSATQIIGDKTSHSKGVSISWYPGKVVIFDNWRWLHARPAVKPEETNNRELQRIMING